MMTNTAAKTTCGQHTHLSALNTSTQQTEWTGRTDQIMALRKLSGYIAKSWPCIILHYILWEQGVYALC